VWKTQHRLLAEELEGWLDRLGGDESRESVVVEERALRLPVAAVVLLGQHVVSKRVQILWLTTVEMEFLEKAETGLVGEPPRSGC
jgi:hypothetical protein